MLNLNRLPSRTLRYLVFQLFRNEWMTWISRREKLFIRNREDEKGWKNCFVLRFVERRMKRHQRNIVWEFFSLLNKWALLRGSRTNNHEQKGVVEFQMNIVIGTTWCWCNVLCLSLFILSLTLASLTIFYLFLQLEKCSKRTWSKLFEYWCERKSKLNRIYPFIDLLQSHALNAVHWSFFVLLDKDVQDFEILKIRKFLSGFDNLSQLPEFLFSNKLTSIRFDERDIY